MKYVKKLVGERIYLSPMHLDDAEIYVKWLNDFSVTDGVGNTTNMITSSNEKKWIENISATAAFQFSIVKLDNNELLGGCGFKEIDHIQRIATIGLFIGDQTNRGKGYGTETIHLLLDFGFHYLNFHNIMLHVFSYNKKAIECYKCIGFKEIGRRREAMFMNGKYYDIISMDILSTEFPKTYIKNKCVEYST